ncbi:unnamed protein product, partial [Mesorhabditis spiculigera]
MPLITDVKSLEVLSRWNSCLGQEVRILTQDEKNYRGHLSCFDTEGSVIGISQCYELTEKNKKSLFVSENDMRSKMAFHISDVRQITIPGKLYEEKHFRLDGAYHEKTKGIAHRELVNDGRWAVDEMLATNAELGVKTSFAEDLSQFTNVAVPKLSKEAIAQAQKLADKIEGDAMSKHNARLENDDEEKDLDKLTVNEDLHQPKNYLGKKPSLAMTRRNKPYHEQSKNKNKSASAGPRNSPPILDRAQPCKPKEIESSQKSELKLVEKPPSAEPPKELVNAEGLESTKAAKQDAVEDQKPEQKTKEFRFNADACAFVPRSMQQTVPAPSSGPAANFAPRNRQSAPPAVQPMPGMGYVQQGTLMMPYQDPTMQGYTHTYPAYPPVSIPPLFPSMTAVHQQSVLYTPQNYTAALCQQPQITATYFNTSAAPPLVPRVQYQSQAYMPQVSMAAARPFVPPNYTAVDFQHYPPHLRSTTPLAGHPPY